MENLNYCGIYKITNKLNNKYYIGSSFNIKRRIRKHFELLKRKSHHSVHFQNAYNKYSENVFIISILEICDKKDLLIVEQKYLDKIVDWQLTYNMSKITSGCKYDLMLHPNQKKIILKLSSGNKGKHTKPFYIDNIKYENLQDAADVFNVDFTTIAKRIKNWKNKEYYYVNNPKIGEYSQQELYSYKPKKEKKKYYCDCGNEITKDSKYCNNCRKERRNKKKYFNQVIIDGIEYDSPKEASRILCIKYNTLLQRIKSNTVRYENYFYRNSPKDISKLTTIDEINQKISKANKGNVGSNHKPFIINDIQYKSLSNAYKSLNIPKTTIRNRLINPKYVNYSYYLD